MSALYRANYTLRNSSVQLNLRSQHKKAAKKQNGRLYRRTFSLHCIVCRLPGQLRHQVDQPSSRLPHRASLSIRLPVVPGQSRSRHRSQPSGNYPVHRGVARDCYRLVYRAYLGMVNTRYRVDHRASKRYNLIASNSLPVTHRHHDFNRQCIAAVTIIGKALPLLSTIHRCHRYQRRQDRYQQRSAATANGNASTTIGNASPPPLSDTPLPATPRPLPATPRLLPATPRPLPATPRSLLATPRPLPATPRSLPGTPRSVAEVWYSFRPVRPVRVLSLSLWATTTY